MDGWEIIDDEDRVVVVYFLCLRIERYCLGRIEED